MGELSTARRNRLPDSAFALPKTREYPIHDLPHARNALARVSAFGSDKEKHEVREAVYSRYPSLRDSEGGQEFLSHHHVTVTGSARHSGRPKISVSVAADKRPLGPHEHAPRVIYPRHKEKEVELGMGVVRGRRRQHVKLE